MCFRVKKSVGLNLVNVVSLKWVSHMLKPPSQHRQSAFTLLEVILALAILAGAIAILGEVMSLASRNASDAQAESQAQLLASSLMDEMLAGVTDLAAHSREPLEADSAIPWVSSVTLGTTDLTGLVSVEVVVEQDVERQFRPVKYRLVRWVSTTEDATSEPTAEGNDDA